MIGIRQMTLLHEKNRYKEFSGSSRAPEWNTAFEGNSSFFSSWKQSGLKPPPFAALPACK